MDDVGRAQVDADGAAGGDDEFVAGDEGAGTVDLFGGVFEFEPPLETDGVDLVGGGFFLGGDVVGIPDGAEGGDGDEDEGEDGETDQAELDERVAVALVGDDGLEVVGLAGAELERGVGEDAGDDDEGDAGDPERNVEDVELGFGDGAFGVEGGLRAGEPVPVAPATEEEGHGGDGSAGKGAGFKRAENGRKGHLAEKIGAVGQTGDREILNQESVRKRWGISSHKTKDDEGNKKRVRSDVEIEWAGRGRVR